MDAITVMIVEDSPVASELIRSTLNADPRLSVICSVDAAEKALRLIPGMQPNVICMDVRLPGMSGIEATRRIMEDCPTPIVIVAADLRDETVGRSMDAMRAGALAVVEKPTVESAEAYKAMARSLCNQFANMSQVKVVRQRFNGRPLRRMARASVAVPPPADGAIEAVGVVASTGGPAAVASFLQGLSPGFSTPVLVVQHMSGDFLQGYAAWLDSHSERNVALARDREKPLPGHVYVGPGGHHLTYSMGLLRLAPDMATCGHVPSGDALFSSLAKSLGSRAIGVLLTGMGDDGARGLLSMHEAGARTLAQDEASCVVYGMPAVAAKLGAVDEVLPIGAIAGRVSELVAQAAQVRRAS